MVAGGNGGMVTITGGTVTATGGSSGTTGAGIGGGGCDDSYGWSSTGNAVITGGSVKASSVSGNVTDGSGSVEHCVTVNGLTVDTSLKCTVNGGNTFSCKTDPDGKLYLWMKAGDNKATILCGNTYHWANVTVSNQDTSTTAGAATAVLDISTGSVTISDGSIAQQNNPNSYSVNDCVISQPSGGFTTNTISVTGGKHNIVLENTGIENDSGCAFSIAPGASVSLTIRGENTLKSGGNGAGLQVPEGASVAITGTVADTLMATGSNGGAGIGGSGTVAGANSGAVTITGGTVTATGSSNGAGIGGGAGAEGGNGKNGSTAITGGSVQASSVSGDVTDGSGSIEHCVTVSDLTANTNTKCSVNGENTFSCKTDLNGKLYLWMKAGENRAAICCGESYYVVNVTVSDADVSAVAGILPVLDIGAGSIAISDGSITQQNNPNSYNVNDCVITQLSSGPITNTIAVTGGKHSVVLENADVENGSGCAFSVAPGAVVNLVLSGKNILKSGGGGAGLGVPSGATVFITGTGQDSFTATGVGAGIGGGNGENGGTVVISGGTVNAYGGTGSAGIGGGRNVGYNNGGSGGSVIITGGIVTAVGGGGDYGGAGIGGGIFYDSKDFRYAGSGGSLTVSGGTVYATGNNGGAGIGGGGAHRFNDYGGFGAAGLFTGVSVFACSFGLGFAPGAGFGGGGGTFGGAGGALTVSGGTVYASAEQGVNYHGAGIGGGGSNNMGAAGGTVNISGGTVFVTGGSTGIGGSYGWGDGGNYGSGGQVTITGGSVSASIQSTPTGDGGIKVYPTNVTLPSGKDIDSLSVTQGSAVSYGLNDMQADDNKKLYLYLPACAGDTIVNVTADRTTYSGYHGTVETSGTNVLKMDQNLTVLGVAPSYIYGQLFTPTVTGGAAAITAAITYSGIDTVTGSTITDSSVPPTNVGSYTVKAIKAENAAYYGGTASIPFFILPKSLSDASITVLDIPNQLYTGNPVALVVAVKNNACILALNKDYTVSCSDAAVGTATAVVNGTGNYTGSISKNFTIEQGPTVAVIEEPGSSLSDWSSSVTLAINYTAGSSGLQSIVVLKEGDSEPTTIEPQSDGTYRYVLAQNGSYTFTVTSHSGFTASQTIAANKIDTTAPTLGSVDGNPTTPVLSASLCVTATPGASGLGSAAVSCQSTDGQWTQIQDASIDDKTNPDGSHTYTYTTVQNGTYKFTVTSQAGVAADSSSITVTQIDVMKPVVQIESNGYTEESWTNQNVTLNASNSTANLGSTAYEYSTDNGTTWTAFNGSVLDTEEGTRTYSIRATSASGVKSAIETFTVKIDKTAPTNMLIAFAQNPFRVAAHFATFGIFFGNTVDVIFSADDANGGGVDYYEYQAVPEDGIFNLSGTWQTGLLSITPDFKGAIYARAVDKAGNASGMVTKSMVVDKTTPVITVQSALTTTDPNAFIPVTVKDNGAGVGAIAYQINGDAEHTVNLVDGCSDMTENYSFFIGSLADGVYDVVINAQDNSGNNAATATVHVNKDTSPKVTNVAVTPDVVSLGHGTTQNFAANVTGINSPPTAVTWNVTGNRSADTTIDANGNLTVAAGESCAVLTVTATSAYDTTKTGQAVVTIHKADQTGFSFSSSVISKPYSSTPFTVTAAGGQGNGTVTYAVTSGEDVVSVSGNTVTIKKTGTAVITATKMAEGSFNQAEATLTVSVVKASTSVTQPPTASVISVIGKLSASTLSGGKADTAGSFAWADPDALVLKTGNYKVIFYPADATNYNPCVCMVKVNVTPVLTNSQSNISLNLTGVTLPANVTSVSFGSTVQGSGSLTHLAVEERMGQNQSLGKVSGLTVYDLKLLNQNGQPISFTGKVTVRIPIPFGMSGNLHVYWYNDADGTVTDMNAKQENGYLVFETTHFSYYAIAELKAQSAESERTTDNPNDPNNPDTPNTGDSGFAVRYWFLVALPAVCGIALTAKKKSFRVKRRS